MVDDGMLASRCSIGRGKRERRCLQVSVRNLEVVVPAMSGSSQMNNDEVGVVRAG